MIARAWYLRLVFGRALRTPFLAITALGVAGAAVLTTSALVAALAVVAVLAGFVAAER